MFVNLITGGIANTTIAINPGTLPNPNNITTGIRYTKLGIVCIKSKIGVIILSTVLFFAINIPVGIPIIIQTRVDTITIASVCIVSSHMPTNPIAIKLIRKPIISFQFVVAFHINKLTIIKNTHQGVDNSSFSKCISSHCNGESNSVNHSPQFAANSLNVASIDFLKLVIVPLSNDGKFMSL